MTATSVYHDQPNDDNRIPKLNISTALQAFVRYLYSDCPAEFAEAALAPIDVSAVPGYVAQQALREVHRRLAHQDEIVNVDSLRDSTDEQVILYIEQALSVDLPFDWVDAASFLTTELSALRIASERKNENDARRELLLSADSGDRGNAECIVTLAGGDFLYTDSMGWLQWTGTHWSNAAAEAEITNVAGDILQERYDVSTGKESEHIHKEAKPTTKRIRDALWQVRWRLAAEVEDFGRAENLLNVANGIVDLATGKLYPHDRQKNFTYCVSTPYEREAVSELWLDLLYEWLQDADMVDFVQRAVGYSITGSVREECAFYVQGPGRSGKGTLINTIVQIIGAPMAKGIAFDIFTGGKNDPQNFRLAPLWNARIVAASENMRYKHLDESTIKTVTGRDAVMAAFKGRDSFSYFPQYKLWLANNWPIRGDAADDAFWSRFHVIPFRNSYIGKEDKTLKDRLLQRQNRMGILAWAIEGARKWYGLGLQPPAASAEELQRQRLQADPVYEWVQSNLRKTSSMTDEVLLDQAYQFYIDDAGDELRKAEFSRRLNGYGYTTKRTGKGADRRQVIPYCVLVE